MWFFWSSCLSFNSFVTAQNQNDNLHLEVFRWVLVGDRKTVSHRPPVSHNVIMGPGYSHPGLSIPADGPQHGMLCVLPGLLFLWESGSLGLLFPVSNSGYCLLFPPQHWGNENTWLIVVGYYSVSQFSFPSFDGLQINKNFKLCDCIWEKIRYAKTFILLSWTEIICLCILKITGILCPWQIKFDRCQIKLEVFWI